MGASCGMENRKPSYDLNTIKAAIGSEETLSITKVARRDAYKLGFDALGIAGVILGIERKMFFKSMTTYADHNVWQDVYFVPAGNLVLYVKFQADVITEFTVMSFKEK
jgi:motility quorum-sensing regulator / GCU-specific mRNA interferase toxin